MEAILKMLFDYQRFENEPTLGRIIDETEKIKGYELEDSELENVAAAGENTLYDRHGSRRGSLAHQP